MALHRRMTPRRVVAKICLCCRLRLFPQRGWRSRPRLPSHLAPRTALSCEQNEALVRQPLRSHCCHGHGRTCCGRGLVEDRGPGPHRGQMSWSWPRLSPTHHGHIHYGRIRRCPIRIRARPGVVPRVSRSWPCPRRTTVPIETMSSSSVVSVAITVNIARGIGLDIGTLVSQYRRTLILSYWGSKITIGIGIVVF